MTMLKNPGAKYRPYPPINLPDRQWPMPELTTLAKRRQAVISIITVISIIGVTAGDHC